MKKRVDGFGREYQQHTRAIDVKPVPPTPEEDKQVARRVVAGRSRDAEDCAFLLSVLGLIPGAPDELV